MSGIGRHTGRAVSGDAHLAQSIIDVLTTPKGTRVMRRSYGSDLPALLDQPINPETVVDAYMAVADALTEWEPRITLARVELADAGQGFMAFLLTDTDGNVLPIDLGGST